MKMEKQGTAQQMSQEQVVIQDANTQAKKQAVVESAGDADDQDFFVPLRHINKVKKNALSEAKAMAKLRDGVFELVVNIQGFEPEDVQIYCIEQAVFVKAKHVTEEGFVNNIYEEKFNLPDDVDTDKLTSGMSTDGILMIRVPRRTPSPEKIVPIKQEVKIEAVKKALANCVQTSFEVNEASVGKLQSELEAQQIVPIIIDQPEDAVKAASAEVIEAMTIGVSEVSGAEAGEAAGMASGSVAAVKAVSSIVASAVLEA